MSAPSVSMSRVPTFMSVSAQLKLTDKSPVTDNKHGKDQKTSAGYQIPNEAQIRFRSNCCGDNKLYIKLTPGDPVSGSARQRTEAAAVKLQHSFLRDLTSTLKVHKNTALDIFLAAGVTKEKILAGQYRDLHRAYEVIEALEKLGTPAKVAGAVVLGAMRDKVAFEGLTGVDLKRAAAFLAAFSGPGVTLKVALERGALLQGLSGQLDATTARHLTHAVMLGNVPNDDVAITRTVSILSSDGAAAGVGAGRALALAQRYKDDFQSLQHSLNAHRRVELLACLGGMTEALPAQSIQDMSALMARCPTMGARDAVVAVTSPKFEAFREKLSLENSAHLVLALAGRGIDHALAVHPELQADIGHAVNHMRNGDTAVNACGKLPLAQTADRIRRQAAAPMHGPAHIETKAGERQSTRSKPTADRLPQTVQVPRSKTTSSQLGVPSTVPRPPKSRENKVSQSTS